MGTHGQWIVFLVSTFVLHYLWEIGHTPLYQGYEGASLIAHSGSRILCALGDVVIAFIAYGLTAALFGRIAWLTGPNWQRLAVVWIGLGIFLTVAYEYFALAKGQWSYTEKMPVLLGIGVSPVLQWLAVPALSLIAVKLPWSALRKRFTRR